MRADQKVTPEDIEAIWTPLLKRLIAQYGKERAKSIFREAVRGAGLDPNDVRIVFPEDVS